MPSSLSHLPRVTCVCVRVCVRVCVYITSHQPIGFSRQKGARKVADLCLPVFDVIDRMYPSLIASGNLEAFAAVPPILYQVPKNVHALTGTYACVQMPMSDMYGRYVW